MDRRPTLAVALSVALLLTAGCTSLWKRDDKPSSTESVDLDPSLQLIGEVTRPWGLQPQAIEGVGLVMRLAGTGSDPQPSPYREMLLADMQARNIDRPKELLASPNTSLVIVRAVIPPGAQEGDRIDLEVRVPPKSETVSLRGGALLKCRLNEVALLNNQMTQGHLMGFGEGYVLPDGLVEASGDKVMQTRGRVLGGGVVTRSRSLGLVIGGDHHSVQTSARIGIAINNRFHTYRNGEKIGVANPTRDDFVELLVAPRYRDNLVRYVRVIESIPLREPRGGRVQRLEELGSELMDPATTRRAALQLEALGTESTTVLERGLVSTNNEVRFYAAEALAYLDHGSAAAVLAEFAAKESAFRWHALTALAAMDDVAGHDALVELIDAESAEARYGAFQILQRLDPHDPLVHGVSLFDRFRLHVVSSAGEPMVHISRSTQPEVVIFGADMALQHPVVLDVGAHFIVKSTSDGQLRVSYFSSGDNDTSMTCASTLADLMATIAQLGGAYPDVVQAVSLARQQGCLAARVEFDALAQPGRKYFRTAEDEDGPIEASIDASTGDIPFEDSAGEGGSANVPLRADAKADRTDAILEDLGQGIRQVDATNVPKFD
ncbi:MAG: flagellar basal body P-ring protein FlgI [Pirellulaceae bacterium]|nr:flagellar basal body P-ring protein FlgI [Planctomycetales bacterium]